MRLYCAYIIEWQVYQVSANQVLQQEAYLLFYARDLEYKPPTTTTPSKPLTPSNSTQARGTVDYIVWHAQNILFMKRKALAIIISPLFPSSSIPSLPLSIPFLLPSPLSLPQYDQTLTSLDSLSSVHLALTSQEHLWLN